MKRFATLALAAALVSGTAMAQAPAAAPAKPSLMARMKAAAIKPAAPAAAAKSAAKPAANNNNAPRTAKSLECSKQADAKNIHGAARKAFMSKCKKA